MGSNTAEWVIRNFKGAFGKDIVYVCGNPVVNHKLRNRLNQPTLFYHIENVWDYGWNKELGMVDPEAMIEKTQELKKQYPKKKFIIHFLQPHHPYLFEDNEKEVSPLTISSSKDKEIAKKAYKKTSKLVLDKLQKLTDEFNNEKTIITADHGECFGEYKIYGHPFGVYTPKLVEVPWFEVKKK
ncbi:MAG: Arylsulfatase A family enzyme [Candidatus Methanohalarchaeum thermophilum]|uniref:Arylsulfatase A family enzyme n=1 Tax=Methanohalarchaeum thermophilum TaxID=1903181 RepID=A0A1Q6DST7_METT1|nr:MAG: Arylsulfatase A family enzyme [Candidatus Methanohalarchaeum thermophilum]